MLVFLSNVLNLNGKRILLKVSHSLFHSSHSLRADLLVVSEGS